MIFCFLEPQNPLRMAPGEPRNVYKAVSGSFPCPLESPLALPNGRELGFLAPATKSEASAYYDLYPFAPPPPAPIEPSKLPLNQLPLFTVPSLRPPTPDPRGRRIRLACGHCRRPRMVIFFHFSFRYVFVPVNSRSLFRLGKRRTYASPRQRGATFISGDHLFPS